jgi:hypothetical protein
VRSIKKQSLKRYKKPLKINKKLSPQNKSHTPIARLHFALYLIDYIDIKIKKQNFICKNRDASVVQP